ncbi:hypothetical protein AGMMS49525_14460 [Bacteroidia bacterium]|nr:hypothetical protein AGMMS49525_14460 [Bacteroidia bacterium]
MAYINRLIDEEIEARLGFSGALLIRGAKSCGKTFAAQQHAKSELLVDIDTRVAGWMVADPALLLRGKTPRLLDEWQIYPELFNYIRREVDHRQHSGQFILTGSANPALNAKIHSGVGRFSVLNMRPMSRFELGLSNGQVSLRDLLNREVEPDLKGVDERRYSIGEVVEQLIFGGWPSLLGKNLKAAIQFSRDYVGLTADTDISRVDGVKRDAAKVLRFMRSFARNISTQTPISTMVEDVNGVGRGSQIVAENTHHFGLRQGQKTILSECNHQQRLPLSAKRRCECDSNFCTWVLMPASFGIKTC